MKRVIGIGNALTDMLVNLKSDSVLSRFKLAKGSMSLVDTTLQTEISKSVAGLPYSLSLGGSAGNTIRAMAKLGCDVGFIGKVGQDTTGDFFVQALDNLGIEPIIFRGRERSGKCVSLISADGERTMVTHLGAALELSAGEIEPSIFEGYDCLYVEGYLVQNHDLILKAARTAKKCGLKVDKIERIDDWYYFPHVGSKDYADGWYEKVEAMQGKDNTYYAGEVMAFGDMEETVEYSRDLVRRFF